MGPRFVRRSLVFKIVKKRKNLKSLVYLILTAPKIRKTQFAMRTQIQEKKPAPILITARSSARRSAQMESIVQQRGLVKMEQDKKVRNVAPVTVHPSTLLGTVQKD